jgi:hypothetical protein
MGLRLAVWAASCRIQRTHNREHDIQTGLDRGDRAGGHLGGVV